jgi:hypothetical protein
MPAKSQLFYRGAGCQGEVRIGSGNHHGASAPCCRTIRSVALSIFGRPSFTPWATAHRCQKATLSDFKSF